MTYYEIQYEKDQTEGRGGLGYTGICFEKWEDAWEFTKSDYMSAYTVMGYVHKIDGERYLIAERSLPKIYSSFKEYNEEHSKESIKRRALSKLSDEEKKILGLKD